MKAQISVEVLILFAFLLIIFVFIVFTVLAKEQELEMMGDYFQLKRECQKIANTMVSVYAGGNGTMATIKTDYFLNLTGNNSIFLFRERVSICTVPVPSYNYSGLTGTLRFSNERGKIKVETI